MYLSVIFPGTFLQTYVENFKKWFYNPGQNSWDTNAIACQIEASSLPPPPSPLGAMLMLCIQVLIQHNQHCLGERGTAEIAPDNNIPQLF